MDTNKPQAVGASQSGCNTNSTLGNKSQDEGGKKKRKKKRGRRRGKKDVILNFAKTTRQRTSNHGAPNDRDSSEAASMSNKNESPPVDTKQHAPIKIGKGKLSLKTSVQDYGGNLNLPANITQREYETTGQFLKRLNRLVAKAKVEANLDDRFDMDISKGDVIASKVNAKKVHTRKPDIDKTELKFGHRKRRARR